MLFRFKNSAKKMHVLIGSESCFNTDKELAQAVDIMMAEGIYISLIKDKQKNKLPLLLGVLEVSVRELQKSFK